MQSTGSAPNILNQTHHPELPPDSSSFAVDHLIHAARAISFGFMICATWAWNRQSPWLINFLSEAPPKSGRPRTPKAS
jgi:hypothetical protein